MSINTVDSFHAKRPSAERLPEDKINLRGIGLFGSLIVFGTASIILILETEFLIPYLSRITGWETVIFWFIVAGLGLFLPLLIAAFIIVKKEGHHFNKRLWIDRLRFKKMTRTHWIWSMASILVIGISSALTIEILKMLVGSVNIKPIFLSFEPLTKDRYWLLAIWFPYWLLNIMGEEIFWRGTILPRQEIVFGKFTWLLHGFLWWIFHLGFGWQLIVTLLPHLFIQSYVVQRLKNTWVGVIIHAGINGPIFLAISFGLM